MDGPNRWVTIAQVGVQKRNLLGRILAECVSKWPVPIEREVNTAVSFAIGEGAG